jgi:hypothetical protein
MEIRKIYNFLFFLLFTNFLFPVNLSSQISRLKIEQTVVNRYFDYINYFNQVDVLNDPDLLDETRTNFLKLFSPLGSTSVIDDLDLMGAEEYINPVQYVQRLINEYDGNIRFEKELVYFCLDEATGNYRAITKKTVKGSKGFNSAGITTPINHSLWLDIIIDRVSLKIVRIVRMNVNSRSNYDIDNDGIFDICDKCEEIYGTLDQNGADTSIDADQDCILDVEDTCPNDPTNKCKKANKRIESFNLPRFGFTFNGSFNLPINHYGRDFLFGNDTWDQLSNGVNNGWSGSLKLDYNPLRFLGVSIAFGATFNKLDEIQLKNALQSFYESRFPAQMLSVEVESDSYNHFYYLIGINTGALGAKNGVILNASVGRLLGNLTQTFSKNQISIIGQTSNQQFSDLYTTEFSQIDIYALSASYRWLINSKGSLGILIGISYMANWPNEKIDHDISWELPGLSDPEFRTELVNFEIVSANLGFFIKI